MPISSDGKKFPYTKEGIAAMKKHEEMLKKKPKKMATPKSKPRHASPKHRMNTERTTGGSYT